MNIRALSLAVVVLPFAVATIKAAERWEAPADVAAVANPVTAT